MRKDIDKIYHGDIDSLIELKTIMLLWYNTIFWDIILRYNGNISNIPKFPKKIKWNIRIYVKNIDNFSLMIENIKKSDKTKENVPKYIYWFDKSFVIHEEGFEKLHKWDKFYIFAYNFTDYSERKNWYCWSI